ncbi:MAG: hypothetical protein M3164_01345 [Actinomycetota bacterium]|nr:hypothetical protein [Actinomycetota bacterium]
MATLLVALLASGCGGRGNSPPAESSNLKSADVSVNWSDPLRSVELPDGWEVRACPTNRPRLCLDLNGSTEGIVRIEDVPGLGQDKTSSRDQVQAVLAVRIQTDYLSYTADRRRRCGEGYEVRTERPTPVVVGGQPGLRYGATGSAGGRAVERTVGYRVFRDGIESLIEVTALEPGGCVTSAHPTLEIEELGSLEDELDRVVAGSRLPPATRFEESHGTVPGRSVDPRSTVARSEGIGISAGV